jgi:hypothetical protein
VHVWFDDEDPDHLYVVEQPGRVFRIDLEGAERTIALDVTDRVGSGGERGLFAVAFQAGRMFVHYTDRAGDTVVSSFALRNGSADPDSEAVFLRQAQPHANHNGGQIAFHEGHLFIGLGDGGGAGDPDGNGQDLSTLLAKILRIDVGNGTEYAVPNDNPFVGRADAQSMAVQF